MKPLGSVAAVIAAIREDADADVEGLEQNAQAEVARIRSLSTHDIVTLPDRERRMSAARRQAQARLAQEDWEDTRQLMADRESWLASAVALGQQHLVEDDAQSRRDRLARLACEALSRLPNCPCEIVVREEDLALLVPEWHRALASTTSRENLRLLAGPLDGGCIVRTADGRASFDNSYAARARRLETAWRSALADVFERAIAASALAFEPRRAPHE